MLESGLENNPPASYRWLPISRPTLIGVFNAFPHIRGKGPNRGVLRLRRTAPWPGKAINMSIVRVGRGGV